jgi:hypothetical protein
MQKFVVTVLLASFVLAPCLAFAQGASTVPTEKQREAEQVAERFIERFRRTLDFGPAWKAFRLSDPSCTQRANGMLNQSDSDRLNLSSEAIEKLYIATMNYYYLKAAHDLSLARISDAEEPFTPREIKAAEKRSKLFQNDDRKPQSAGEIHELIAALNHLSNLYRKYMPRRVMISAAWRANERYLIDRSGGNHTGVLNGNATFCVPEQNKVYIVDRGIFYFYVVEEVGRMKVAGLGID